MIFRTGISRRDVLSTAGAAGGLALAAGLRGARAQASKRIEQFAPELENILHRGSRSRTGPRPGWRRQYQAGLVEGRRLSVVRSIGDANE